MPLNTGVPQGSILGPLLFIIYTSDLPLCLPRECKLFMYADDSTITCSSSNINEIENNLNTALGSIYDWCARNKLTINANKTKSMLIGSKQKVHNTDLNVSIAGSSVVKVNCVKCLGVIIDESLSWGPHVEYVKKTVSSKLGMLNRIRNYVPHSSLLSLFVCLVTPSLDYCCTVWGGRYIYHDTILNKCLKRAARIILQCAFLTPSADMFSKLNWLSFSERVKYRKTTLVFKCVNRMCPMYMTNMFTPLTHIRETRQSTHTVTYKKCQQRLYCLRKLRSFNVDNTILSMFYKSCIQSVLTFSFICWFGNVSQKDKNSLQRIVNISSKVTGVTQSTLTALYEKHVVNKATRILADDKHVLYADYILLPSSRRFRTVTCKTNRKRFSFVPMSIRLLNDKSLGHYF